MKAFVYHHVYTLHAVDCSAVYRRKRIGRVLDARMIKLLIQSTFTSPNQNFGPVYRQHPIWG